MKARRLYEMPPSRARGHGDIEGTRGYLSGNGMAADELARDTARSIRLSLRESIWYEVRNLSPQPLPKYCALQPRPITTLQYVGPGPSCIDARCYVVTHPIRAGAKLLGGCCGRLGVRGAQGQRYLVRQFSLTQDGVGLTRSAGWH